MIVSRLQRFHWLFMHTHKVVDLKITNQLILTMAF